MSEHTNPGSERWSQQLSVDQSPHYYSWIALVHFQSHLEEKLGSQVVYFLWPLHELLYYFLSIHSMLNSIQKAEITL